MLWDDKGVTISKGVYLGDLDVISEGDDGATIIWRDFHKRGNDKFQIWFQKIDVEGNTLWGDTLLWTDGIKIASATGLECPGDIYWTDYQMVPDGLGEAFITWKDYPSTSNLNLISVVYLDSTSLPGICMHRVIFGLMLGELKTSW